MNKQIYLRLKMTYFLTNINFEEQKFSLFKASNNTDKQFLWTYHKREVYHNHCVIQ